MVVGPEEASVEEWLDSYLDGHEQAVIVVIPGSRVPVASRSLPSPRPRGRVFRPVCEVYVPVIVDLVSSFSLISLHPLDECVLSPSLVHFTSYPIGRTVIAIAVLSNTDMGRSNRMHSTWVTMVFKFMIGLLDFYATRNFVQNDLNNRRFVRLLRVHLDGIPTKQAGMDRRCTCAPFMCIKIRILTPIHRHPYLLRFSRTGYQSSLRKVAKSNL